LKAYLNSVAEAEDAESVKQVLLAASREVAQWN